MSCQRLSKAKAIHPRERRSPRHYEWKKLVATGMKIAKQRPVESGMLTANDLAKQSKLSPRAIRYLLDSGQLKFIQIGSRRFVLEAEWQRFLSSNISKNAA